MKGTYHLKQMSYKRGITRRNKNNERIFKNPTARELFLASLRIDEETDRIEQKEMKELGCSIGMSGSGEMHTEAAGLRVLADDLEDGFISEEEIDI